MFNQPNNPSTATGTAIAGEVTDRLTMDMLMGESVSDARLLESKILPAGFYIMSLADYEEKSYEVKKEGHPLEGQDATQLNLIFNIDEVDTSGPENPSRITYATLNLKGRKPSWDGVDNAEMAKYVGDTVTFSIFFGDDELLDEKTGQPKMRGRNQLRTILHKFVGADNAELEGYDINSATFGQLLETARKVRCIVPITNRKDFRDDTRVQSEIDLMSDFGPFALGGEGDATA